jgi:hypothetical protein
VLWAEGRGWIRAGDGDRAAGMQPTAV